MNKKIVVWFFLVSFTFFMFVSCAPKQEKEPVFTEGPFLEMNGNGGKFYTDEDISKAFAYREKQRKNLDLFILDNPLSATLEVPLKVWGPNLTPLINIGINDHKVNMLFDTGAGKMILPLHILRGTLRMLPPFEEQDFYYFVQEIAINRYSYSMVPGFSVDANPSPYGVIPWILFGRLCDFLTIDFQAEKIILHSKNSNSFTSSVKPIHCEINEAFHIIIDIELDGRKTKAFLDTGWNAKGHILNDDGSYKIKNSANHTIVNFVGTYSETFNTHEVKEIRIGDTKIEGSELLLITTEHYGAFPEFFPWLKEEGIDVCLGSLDFFNKCHFTIDYKNKLCWIEPYDISSTISESRSDNLED